MKDPRVEIADNQVFLDLMERYFEQPDEVKLRDARPSLHYQVCHTATSNPFCTLIDLISRWQRSDAVPLVRPCTDLVLQKNLMGWISNQST